MPLLNSTDTTAGNRRTSIPMALVVCHVSTSRVTSAPPDKMPASRVIQIQPEC
jgi:hypothetical protein